MVSPARMDSVDRDELRRTLGRLITSATVLADRSHAEPEHHDSRRMFLELHGAAHALQSACQVLVP